MTEAFFFAYQVFIIRPDEILAHRDLGRVHHRILFFIARYPELNVKGPLVLFDVIKQALNILLRQLLGMDLIDSATADDDERRHPPGLTAESVRLEKVLHHEQLRLSRRCSEEVGGKAISG